MQDITLVIFLCKVKAHTLDFKGKGITCKFRLFNTIEQESGVFEDSTRASVVFCFLS